MTVEIKVCMGSACFARGNAENIEFIENYVKENGLAAKIELDARDIVLMVLTFLLTESNTQMLIKIS